MHTPKIFAQSDDQKLIEMIRANSFATLVCQTSNGLRADHIPLYFTQQADQSALLRGHIGKANPLWEELANNSQVLAIFHGPQAYISPNYYPSKQQDGKVVPTWNYAVVHVRGRIFFNHDSEWKLAMLNALTDLNEQSQTRPWSVADAPEQYTERMLAGIVGLEIQVSSLEGQWKLSQNKQAADRDGVVQGTLQSGNHEMATLMERQNLDKPLN